MSHLTRLFSQHPARPAGPLHPEQVVDRGSGPVTPAGLWTQLNHFLILGTAGGVFPARRPRPSMTAAQPVQAALALDGARVVNLTIEASSSERAARRDPALFVLAMAASPVFADARTNQLALAALPLVARTGRQLCRFAEYVDAMRGWGRGLRSAIAHWYLAKPVPELTRLMLRQKQGERWTHRDLLRLAHPKPASESQRALFGWAVEGRLTTTSEDLSQLYAFELARQSTEESEIVRLVEDYRLTHEMIPARWTDSPRVWEALLDTLPYTAMLRRLRKMTGIGLLQPFSPATALVVSRLIDRRRIERARVHPAALLAALAAYRRHSPVRSISDALEEAFYRSFEFVEASGSRIYLALDTGAPAAPASAVMAMATTRSEPDAIIAAFDEQIRPLAIGPRDRLDRVSEALRGGAGASDASLPPRDALERGLRVDAFLIVTGSEGWDNNRQPVRALEEYRRQTGIPAKLVVIAVNPLRTAVTDPGDSRQLLVAGFNAGVPAVIREFLRE
ncbi:MAG: TROVE domain-containing protein [Bryobacteraceae bacterium]|nr:TROVE domain-containing protein [Bryobacteraceae bacterium]